MPLYEYQCKKCNKLLQIYTSLDNIKKGVKCECGNMATRKYSLAGIHIFKPYFNVMAGEQFNSKKDAKEKCKKKYLELSD